MVHTHAPAPAAPTGAPGAVPAIPQPTSAYVLVPDGLILAFAHDPLAVGVYVAVARLVLAARGAVPLAARDLAAWIGSDRDADRAAMMRRIVKLADAGWLIVTRRTAAKHHLLPTWGSDGSGTPRPWRFDQASLGKPDSLRGRRVPLALLDIYLGRLDPRAGQRRALISRYLGRPLLDLVDLGVYAVGLRAETAPTPRLRHLQLMDDRGVPIPPDGSALLTQATCGTLTTLDDDGQIVLVQPSLQGHMRWEWTLQYAAERTRDDTARTSGSDRGSIPGSDSGSGMPMEVPALGTHGDAECLDATPPGDLIAWESRSDHESTTYDPPTQPSDGGGQIQSSVEQTSDTQPRSNPIILNLRAPALDPLVVAGHRALNTDRPILPGEWLELSMLQQDHGSAQLLIWQARAARAVRLRVAGISPAYYRACAIPRPPAERFTDSGRSSTQGNAQRRPDPHPTRDSRREALLAAMGIRARRQLDEVPLALIAAWHTAVRHPGITTRFGSPLGFAVSQMRLGNPPPPTAELERWAAQYHHASDPHATWRHAEVVAIEPEAIAREASIEAQVRAIAPPDATLAELCALAELLESGASTAEAQEQLARQRAGGQL